MAFDVAQAERGQSVRPERSRGALIGLAVALLAAVAWAHAAGFHTRLTFTVSRSLVQGLLVMDVDAGERCSLLRAQADLDHDGLLSRDERALLAKKLTGMATRNLSIGVSSAVVPLAVKDTRLSIREDPRVSDTGLSLALLLELPTPYPITPGSTLEVTDTSPDLSPVLLEVFQTPAEGAKAEPPFRGEVEAGKQVKVRLGILGGTR